MSQRARSARRSRGGSSQFMQSNQRRLEDIPEHELSREQRVEKQKLIIRKQLMAHGDRGPAPDFAKRSLVFDSLRKITGRDYDGKSSLKHEFEETRGTFVYTWGAGYHGQLGRAYIRGQKKYSTVPEPIAMPLAIRQVACGGLHTAAITDTGKVFTWGDARQSQLGYVPPGFTNQPEPLMVEFPRDVFAVQIACGQKHTIVLSASGRLWSWGTNKMGQLGHGDRQTRSRPKLITPSDKFCDVSCGDNHSAAVSLDGKLYTWGCGSHGQLGLGMPDQSREESKNGQEGQQRSIDEVTRPRCVDALDAVVASQVECGAIHTAVVTTEGELFLFGFGEHFYQEESQNFFYTPVRIPFSTKIVQVACGQSHILALDERGDVYAWGNGSYGQLGIGQRGDLNTPRIVLMGKSVAQVAAGRYHSVALTSFGALYSWGCGESGQLGHGDDNNQLVPRVVAQALGTVVGAIACGEHHSAMLSATPWDSVHEELHWWQKGEQAELEIKRDMVGRSHVGLHRLDLERAAHALQVKKAEWVEEKRESASASSIEEKKWLNAIRSRNQLDHSARHPATTTTGKSDGARTRKGVLSVLPPRPSSALVSAMSQARPADQKSEYYVPPKARSAWGEPGAEDAASGLPPTAPLPAGPTDAAARKPRRPASAMPRSSSRRGGAAAQSALAEWRSSMYTGRDSQMNALENRMREISQLKQSVAARGEFLKDTADMMSRVQDIVKRNGQLELSRRHRKTQQMVFNVRKMADQQREKRMRKERLLKAKRQELASLVRSNKAFTISNRSNEQQKNRLLMRLNTVTIKTTETEQDHKNYSLNIAILKDEELERHYALDDLRKQCNEADIFLRKWEAIQSQSFAEKKRAQGDRSKFKREVQEFRDFMASQLAAFRTISRHERMRILKRHRLRQQLVKKRESRVQQRVDRLAAEARRRDEEADLMTKQLESIMERKRYFEKRFQQISNATGLDDPEGIINKFALKERIRTGLNVEVQSKLQELAQLRGESDKLQKQLEKVREQYVHARWKDVDTLEEKLREEFAQKSGLDTTNRDLEKSVALTTEGLVTMCQKLTDVAGLGSVSALQDIPTQDWDEAKVQQVVDQVQQRILAIAAELENLDEALQDKRSRVEEMQRLREANQRARSQRADAMFAAIDTMKAVAKNKKEGDLWRNTGASEQKS